MSKNRPYAWAAATLFLSVACRMGSDSASDVNPYDDGCRDCADESPEDGRDIDGEDVPRDGMPEDGESEDGSDGEDAPPFADVFTLRDDFDGPCQVAGGAVDVNLGNTARTTVRALHCQIFGSEPPADLRDQWTVALEEREYVRRIDVARTFCQMAGRECNFVFSDPWQAQVELTERCTKVATRDLGAVLMFFSECPSGVNCEMNWANTHALGMKTPHALYGYGNTRTGFYHPDNPGFWRREFLDARWAGLSFLLLNTYGPDLIALPRAVEALDDIGGGIALAMMDDTWTWGRSETAPWNGVPNLADTESAASLIYESKWKPFYETLPSAYWYEVDGRPLVYFYNAGTLEPRTAAPAVLRRVKERFETDFGVVPFVAVDSAFFEDEAAMNQVADARFTWDTFRFGDSSSALAGTRLDHAMVRWDALGRDHPGRIASASDQLHKDPAMLTSFLERSRDADLAVIATWNDLGEGTGISRNYDYFFGGHYLKPHHFLSLLRAAQCDASVSSSSFSPSSP